MAAQRAERDDGAGALVADRVGELGGCVDAVPGELASPVRQVEHRVDDGRHSYRQARLFAQILCDTDRPPMSFPRRARLYA